MIAEPLNKILEKQSNTKDILFLYNKPFSLNSLVLDIEYPEFIQQYISVDEYDKLKKKELEKTKTLFFKNIDVEWDSCDCGDGYGCSHGSWIYQITITKPEYIQKNIINRIQTLAKHGDKRHVKEWIFEVEGDTYMTEVDMSISDSAAFSNILPKTLNDFVNDCCRVGIQLEWADWVVQAYFEKNEINQLSLFESYEKH